MSRISVAFFGAAVVYALAGMALGMLLFGVSVLTVGRKATATA